MLLASRSPFMQMKSKEAACEALRSDRPQSLAWGAGRGVVGSPSDGVSPVATKRWNPPTTDSIRLLICRSSLIVASWRAGGHVTGTWSARRRSPSSPGVLHKGAISASPARLVFKRVGQLSPCCQLCQSFPICMREDHVLELTWLSRISQDASQRSEGKWQLQVHHDVFAEDAQPSQQGRDVWFNIPVAKTCPGIGQLAMSQGRELLRGCCGFVCSGVVGASSFGGAFCSTMCPVCRVWLGVGLVFSHRLLQ